MFPNKRKFRLSRKIEEYYYEESLDDSRLDFNDNEYSSICNFFHQSAISKSKKLNIQEEAKNVFQNQHFLYSSESENSSSVSSLITPQLSLKQNISSKKYSINETPSFSNFRPIERTKRRQSKVPFERIQKIVNDSPFESPVTPVNHFNFRKSSVLPNFKVYFEKNTQTSNKTNKSENKSTYSNSEKYLTEPYQCTFNNTKKTSKNVFNDKSNIISFSKAHIYEPEDEEPVKNIESKFIQSFNDENSSLTFENYDRDLKNNNFENFSLKNHSNLNKNSKQKSLNLSSSSKDKIFDKESYSLMLDSTDRRTIESNKQTSTTNNDLDNIVEDNLISNNFSGIEFDISSNEEKITSSNTNKENKADFEYEENVEIVRKSENTSYSELSLALDRSISEDLPKQKTIPSIDISSPAFKVSQKEFSKINSEENLSLSKNFTKAKSFTQISDKKSDNTSNISLRKKTLEKNLTKNKESDYDFSLELTCDPKENFIENVSEEVIKDFSSKNNSSKQSYCNNLENEVNSLNQLSNNSKKIEIFKSTPKSILKNSSRSKLGFLTDSDYSFIDFKTDSLINKSISSHLKNNSVGVRFSKEVSKKNINNEIEMKEDSFVDYDEISVEISKFENELIKNNESLSKDKFEINNSLSKDKVKINNSLSKDKVEINNSLSDEEFNVTLDSLNGSLSQFRSTQNDKSFENTENYSGKKSTKIYSKGSIRSTGEKSETNKQSKCLSKEMSYVSSKNSSEKNLSNNEISFENNNSANITLNKFSINSSKNSKSSISSKNSSLRQNSLMRSKNNSVDQPQSVNKINVKSKTIKKPKINKFEIVKQKLPKYYETLTNKTPTIIYPQGYEEEDTIRRSKRIRVKPLDFWRNQKLKYKIDENTNCLCVDGVEKGFKTENPFKRKIQNKIKKHNEKSKKRKLSIDKEQVVKTKVKKVYIKPSEESIHQNLNKSQIELSEKIKSQAKEFCGQNDLQWKESAKTKGVHIALMKRDKDSKTGTHANGFVKLDPFVQKPRQTSGNYSTKYVVMFGACSVKIEDKPAVILKSMDSFILEKNTFYSIDNLRRDELLLYFDLNSF